MLHHTRRRKKTVVELGEIMTLTPGRKRLLLAPDASAGKRVRDIVAEREAANAVSQSIFAALGYWNFSN